MMDLAAEFWEYLGYGNNLAWLAIGCGYFAAAIGAAFSRLDYPAWFITLYLGVAGAIGLKITQPLLFTEWPQVYIDVFLMIMAVALGLGFFIVVTHYAMHRPAYDDLRATFGSDDGTDDSE